MSCDSALTLYELRAESKDFDLLDRFYQEIYVQEFTEENEKESPENMKAYLRLKSQGWYGLNNYHILMLLDGTTPVGCSVMDYVEEPNAGIIEFLVVATNWRSKGIGKRLLDYTEKVLYEDSLHSFSKPLDWIIAEMNDPFKSIGIKDSMDTFQRARIWHKWGYRKLSFPYRQPALSQEKGPVDHLLLMAKIFRKEYMRGIQGDVVRAVLRAYLKWAMRIDDPEQNAEYLGMTRYLDREPMIKLLSLASYIGESEEKPLVIQELTDNDGENLEETLALYTREFQEVETAVPVEEFLKALYSSRLKDKSYSYHLWAIRQSTGEPIEGFASFFTFPISGFGGYIAFSFRLRGQGKLAELIARIEQQMVRDDKGARGWYIECDASVAPIFRKKGFFEVALDYRQPPLAARAPYPPSMGPNLHLLYKEFGECFEPPKVRRIDLLNALTWIFRVIYHMDDPMGNPLFQQVEKRLYSFGKDFVPWRED